MSEWRHQIGGEAPGKGYTIDAQTQISGVTALSLASRDGHGEVVEKMVRKGAIVDVQNNSCRRALIQASHDGYRELCSHSPAMQLELQSQYVRKEQIRCAKEASLDMKARNSMIPPSSSSFKLLLRSYCSGNTMHISCVCVRVCARTCVCVIPTSELDHIFVLRQRRRHHEFAGGPFPLGPNTLQLLALTLVGGGEDSRNTP